ncbi:MAG TPA: PIN domain-containing protein [Candidatus Acidoferrum sp.]|jgi:hypothetical protein
MILLDTNVLSALMHREPELPVVKWLDRQPASSIWISSITIMEVRYGLQILSKGRRREALTKLFDNMLAVMLEGRVASFDTAAAQQAADLMAARRPKGRPGESRDTMIAGIALATRATLATRNIAHFADLSVPVVNPWTA